MLLVLHHRRVRDTAGEDASATDMFIRLVVVDEQLSVLSVTARLLAGTLYYVEDVCRLAEDGVHFLQGAVGGLRVEEVDDGDDEGVSLHG